MNLVEGILQQCNRVRGLIPMYESIGPTGSIAAHMMRESISIAEQALAGGDIIEMLAAYKDLEGYKE